MDTSPVVGFNRPAMIEINVVLPQPDGPTSSVISSGRTSRSMPRSASVRVSPVPNSFVTPPQCTAGAPLMTRVDSSRANMLKFPGLAAVLRTARFCEPPLNTKLLLDTHLPSENDGRLQVKHTPDAEQAGQSHDDGDGQAGASHHLPGNEEASQVDNVLGRLEEDRRQAHAGAVAEHTNH